MAESSSNTEVFVYTEGAVVPQDVVRVGVHSSVTVIPEEAFYKRQKLKKVQLCEGVIEIGKKAFMECEVLTKITIPSSVTIIHEEAFADCYRLQEIELCEGLREIRSSAFECCPHLRWICLPNSLEHIGEEVLLSCKAFQVRVPPLVTTISSGMICHTDSTCSIELPESLTQIGETALEYCRCLRNIAIPPNAGVQYDAFDGCMDLQHLFGSEVQLINALKHRFDKLPIHKMIYYQSFNNMTVEQLNNALDVRSGQRRSSRMKLDQTGNKQDCLGMTPLHILACSTVQSIDLYKVLVNKYPETLVTEDRWEALPLLYAILGNAPTIKTPNEIVQFLVESYKSLYPNHHFNWNNMMLSLARLELALRPKPINDVIRYVWGIQKEAFPDQNFDWSIILEDAVTRWDVDQPVYISNLSFRHLVRLSVSERANSLGYPKVKHYTNEMVNKVYTTDLPESSQGRRDYIAEVQAHLVRCENEYRTLKEATTLLELVLWKKKMDDHCQERNEKRRIKRVKIEELAIRQQCRVGSGADVVIGNVMQYLVNTKKTQNEELTIH